MKSLTLKFITGLLLGAYLAVPLFQSVKADDTEVYFVDGSALSLPNPKIMLALDYSSNMNGGGTPPLLDRLKVALTQLANDPTVNNSVDLGFMTISQGKGAYKGPNGVIRYPAEAFNAPISASFLTAVSDLNLSQTVSGNTPTVQGMSEVSRYFSGIAPKYNTNLTHSAALSGGLYTGARGASCAKAMVVLGRGQINSKGAQTADISSIVPSSYCDGSCDDRDLVRYMREVQGITTYAIDPGSTGQNALNLDAWADRGGTKEAINYDANAACNDEGGLCKILTDIVKEVASQGSSFVQAGVTVSQQNRLTHDNSLYFAQFQADNIARWPGNLKKYKLSGGALVDVAGDSAVDTSTGLFNEVRNATTNQIDSSKSFWSDSADGNQVELGGAAAELSQFLTTTPHKLFDNNDIFQSWTRKVFTDKSGSLQQITLDETNGTSNLSLTDLGVTAAEFKPTIRTILGYRLEDTVEQFTGTLTDPDTGLRVIEDDRGNSIVPTTGNPDPTYTVANVASTTRQVGDPLHSVPKVVQYTGPASGDTQRIYMGSNLGYLHSFYLEDENPSSTVDNGGLEAWSYIPSELLTDMKKFFSDDKINGDATKHNYGLDGEIFIAHADTNNNLKVDTGDDPTTKVTEVVETALLFVGMRRGGGNYYVIDISLPDSPSFAFKITGGSTNFAKLSQSWSAPVITNIPDGNDSTDKRKTVVIFGGGYDTGVDYVFAKDLKDTTDPDYEPLFDGTVNEGNDVFIYSLDSADAAQPLLWKLSTSGLTAATEISAVPANVRAVSLDNDSISEHLYVTDVMGKVFRFDMTGNTSSAGFSVTGGKILDVSSGLAIDSDDVRRFYYPPSIAYIPRPGGNSFVAVAVGSGYRAHPLDDTIQDYFYMLRDTDVLASTKSYPVVNFNPALSADANPLKDVTTLINPSNSDDIVADQEVDDPLDATDGKKGWFIKLKGLDATVNGVLEHFDGEKSIAEARILFGRLVFTTYIPTLDLSRNVCAPVVGKGRIYGVNVIDGTSFFNTTTRSIDLTSDGIPPIFQLLYTDGAANGTDFIGLVGNEVIDGNFTDALTAGYDNVLRVNWRKKSE